MSATSDRLDALVGSDIQITVDGFSVPGKMGTDITYTADGSGKEIITWTDSAGFDHYCPVDKKVHIKDLT